MTHVEEGINGSFLYVPIDRMLKFIDQRPHLREPINNIDVEPEGGYTREHFEIIEAFMCIAIGNFRTAITAQVVKDRIDGLSMPSKIVDREDCGIGELIVQPNKLPDPTKPTRTLLTVGNVVERCECHICGLYGSPPGPWTDHLMKTRP